MQNKRRLAYILALTLCSFGLQAKAALIDDLLRLQQTYPDHIVSVSERALTWKDGSLLRTQDKQHDISLADQISDVFYLPGVPMEINLFSPTEDPGRMRYEPFFRAMYGATKEEVEKKLVMIYWMPRVFGHRYPLLVTTVNGVDKQFRHLSAELEKLPPSYYKFLDHPAGTYKWRTIAGTPRLSPHSFGIAIDINTAYSHYWRWDLMKENRWVSEDAPLFFRNHLPWEIVLIFEKHGFIWGGKWRHYDTMHFEYRPELNVPRE
jgi:peptidoglycan LD-endopeptidase CwlK